MNIQAIFSHMFVKRGFLGLLALCWGFMLGGSLLMTAVTYGSALAGADRFSVIVYQIIVLAMVLPVAWLVMEEQYRLRTVTSIRAFARAFFVASFFGAVMPALMVVGTFVSLRDAFFPKRPLDKLGREPLPLNFHLTRVHASIITMQRRKGLMGFVQDLMDRYLLKLAH